MMQGSNLSGGDCVWDSYPVATGPISGTDYLFVTTKEIDRLVDAGMTVFRLLFSWECLQPKPWQAPDANAGNYAAYYQAFKYIVDYITKGRGLTCIIDIHGGRDSTFGAYRDVKIGKSLTTGEPVADLFENLYWHLGRIFAGNPRVQWGLTNEPVGMTAAAWFGAAQKAINALRKVGSTQPVWCPGIAFSGAGTWGSSGNAAAWNLTDPANNLGVQVHMYLDANSGGGGVDIVNEDIGVTRLKATIDWARAKGLKVLLGEVAMAAANTKAKATWAKLHAYMTANADVLASWCWWSTGPNTWWGGYQFNLCDTALGRSNLALIADALKLAPVVDVAALQAEIAALETQNAALKKALDGVTSALDSCTQEGIRLQRIITVVRAAVNA